jgi:hypothetical protein
MKTLWGIVCIFVLAYYFTHGEEDRGVVSMVSWLLACA